MKTKHELAYDFWKTLNFSLLGLIVTLLIAGKTYLLQTTYLFSVVWVISLFMFLVSAWKYNKNLKK